MKLADIRNKSLLDWIIEDCYMIELEEDLMGYYPLIEDSTEKQIVCDSIHTLKLIWDSLPHKKVMINKVPFLINNKLMACLPIADMDENVDSDMFKLILLGTDWKKIKYRYDSLLGNVADCNTEFPTKIY